jgi:hypothetical protein
MGKHLTGQMHLIYLDQCVISRLIHKPENEPWSELRAAIFDGHARRRLLCPTSLEHLVETSAMIDGDAIAADKVMRILSSGWSLTIEPRLIARQIFCAVRNMKMTRGQFLQRNLWQPLSRPGALKALRELKEGLDPHNEWLMQGVNEMNAMFRSGKRSGNEILDVMIRLSSQSTTKRLTAAIFHALDAGRAEILPNRDQQNCRDWPSTVVYTLVKEHQFRMSALLEFQMKLEHEGISFIPTLRIKSELHAFQLANREKIEPRDQYDITRIGCALPYADILITDGGKAHAIRELGLDEQFDAEVFSMKRGEIPALVSRLKELSK